MLGRNAIEESIVNLRNAELTKQLQYKLWNVGIFLSFSLSPTLVSLATFSVYTMALGKTLTADKAFPALSLFGLLNVPLSLLPMMSRFLAEASVASGRIEAFLMSPEVPPPPPAPLESDVAMDLKASKLAWPDGSVLLQDVDLKIKKGEFVAIIGKTGSGKSGLLQALLGELPIKAEDGKVAVTGTVGYCSQNAWLRNAPMDENVKGDVWGVAANRYATVLDACALSQDIEALPAGDKTMIGDRGINLSGGQKQRVALARAVYPDAEVLVLDDVLSALDSHVVHHVCSKLLKGPLTKGKTVLLVTHSLRALPLADRIIALGDQKIIFDGSYEAFCSSGLSDEVVDQGQGNAESASSSSSNGDPEEAVEEVGTPSTQTGSEMNPKTQGGKQNPGDGDVTGLPPPTAGAPAAATATSSNSNGAGTSSSSSGRRPSGTTAAGQEETSQGHVTWSVYLAYIKASGGICTFIAFLIALACTEGSKNLSDAWLARWSKEGGRADDGLKVYALLALLSVAAGMCYIMLRIFLGQRASRFLHTRCQHVLLRAKMSFYDNTPIGQVLNRLAEDTSILDYNLPMTVSINMSWAWKTASIVVMCMLVGWYLIFVMLPLFFVFGRVARRYMPATRDLRRLDAAGRSPIIGHFTETLMGAPTIRVMGMAAASVASQVSKLESQMEAYYLANVAPRWLSLRLNIAGAVLVGSVSALAIYFGTRSSGLSAATAGLAITYAMRMSDSLGMVNTTAADRETQMVSAERLQSYIDNIEQEAPLEVPETSVARDWPPEGNIVLSKVCARYRADLPLVLNELTLTVNSGERMGIVGRTGCGKSSLLMVLMRILEPESGGMSIDSVDILKLGLHTLRSRVALIPQEPTILAGTVRFNLDPLRQKSDNELWGALEKAEMRQRVKDAGGLDSAVEEGGGNYSVGELQLLCLARAVLRRLPSGGVLLLDEATSSLDVETDKKVQRVIRSEFHCTTVAIAHRVQTLLDYDRICVLDAGQVVECDSPGALLATPSSLFYKFAEQAGVATATSSAASAVSGE